MFYRRVSREEMEAGEKVQFVGVYALEWGELDGPTDGFVEAEDYELRDYLNKKKRRGREMRKFIIRGDTIKKVQEALKDNKEVLHDFDTGLCTLSPYMPTHLDLGNEDCCGIFMGIAENNGVICNECGMTINDAINKMQAKLKTYARHFDIKEGDFVTVVNAIENAPDETFRVIRSGKLGGLILNDDMGTEISGLYPEAIVKIEEECPICHGEGSTTDHRDPCSNCDGKGYI